MEPDVNGALESLPLRQTCPARRAVGCSFLEVGESAGETVGSVERELSFVSFDGGWVDLRASPSLNFSRS